jgi:alkylation response protein AidB-like acyl-CoA dehydrogenase
MPADHSEVRLTNVRVPHSSIVGELDRGLMIALLFVHENRIRQAASGVGAAQFCVDRSVEYANQRIVFGKPLSRNQAIQFPLVELHTETAMVRGLVRETAQKMDEDGGAAHSIDVSMCNYRANRLVCEAADRAIQVHGGLGYTRNMPFEHIYRHHRRYRITEGSEEIQMRNVAKGLFGFGGGR